MAKPLRLCAFALGLICSVLGCIGAYEFAHGLEGKVTYLVLAAPVIAAAAALIPVFAEATWRHGKPLKALLWWAVLVPAGATVFLSLAERVHVAKAGAQAERNALRSVASRAEAALTLAEGRLVSAQADANRARGQKQCGPDCRSKLAAETTAKADVSAAKRELLSSQSKAVTDSAIQAPAWLLPAALDLVAFMAMWTAFSGNRKRREVPAVKVSKPVKRQKPRLPKLRAVANDNVRFIPAA